MERYRLIFNGQRCGDYAKLPLEHHIRQLKLPEQASSKILEGKKIALRTGMSLAEMQQQKAAFTKLGLVTEHQLQLSPDILKVGLRKRGTSPQSQTSATKSKRTKPRRSKPVQVSDGSLDLALPVYLVDDTLTPPGLFNRPCNTSIDADYKSLKDKKVEPEPISVSSHQYQFNSLLLLAIAAAIGLSLQSYVVVLIKSFGLPNLAATVAGIVFLLACVAMLPRLLQPLLSTTLLFDHGEIELFEQPEPILGRKRTYWQTIEGAGEFVVSVDKAQARSTQILYDWNTHYCVQQTSNTAIEEIQSAITDGTVIEIAQTLYDRLKPYISRWLPQGSIETIDWSEQPASAVCDANGEVVALLYEEDQAAYRIVRAELQHEEVLHAFCLAVHRRGLA